MTDLAMRIETQGGTYTNYPGETTAVFDVTVAAVMFDPDIEAEGVSDDGRPVIAGQQGAVITKKEYAYNIFDAPDNYWVEPVGKGIYADNPAHQDNIATEVVELLGVDGEKHIATFIGRDAVAGALGQLMSFDSCRSAYVADMVTLAVNYAQRRIPG
jgi:hypothetical protein